MTVNVAPSIGTQPASQTVNEGQTASFSVVASGSGTLTYQWKKNGSNISGATSSSYTTPATSSADNAAVYTVTVSNSVGSVTSSNATLTVNVAPTISTQPASQTVNEGQTVSFGVVASGSGTLSYQWKKNGSNISGATSSTYTTPATSSADSAAVYTVTVSNSVGNVTSSNATLTVNVAPSISTQPASLTVKAGETASFSVVASGSGTLTYQWKKNGSNISGATSSSYTTPATSSADNAAVYTVTVSNSVGSVTSSNATLTVNVAPSIGTQPASQTVNEGQTASFSVVASGSGTLTYQWKKNGSNISGATSSTYTTPATSSADNAAVYTVTVSNSVGNVTSSNATLTVNVAPSISTQPASLTVKAGETASFSVVASGSGTLTYQWKKNGSNISGATSSSYTTPATSSADNAAVYTVTVSNSVGSVTSSNATLTVNVAPSIGTQPASQTVNEGQTASFSVVASGSGTLTYQWKKNGSNISGATASTYTTPATSSADNAAVYTVTVSNSVGSVTSSNATLNVNVAPTISTQPASQTVNEGQTVSFGVVASGTAPFTYQWKKNGSNISGATSNSYTTPATSSADSGAVFTVVVSNSVGNVTSSNATLTVTVAPSITSQPASQTVNEGQTATFSVTATGTSPSYQWKKNGSNISGATSSSYTTPATSSADNAAVYTVTVSNSAGTVTSGNATLTVNVAPSITTQPASQTVDEGQTVSFGVVASGSGTLTYQWKKNGSNISGATASMYTTPATSSADTGAVFTVVVSNSVGSVTSSNATLTVNVAPSISTQPASQTVTEGQTASFGVVASGSGTLSYQWKKNGSNISGATSSTYTTPATSSADNAAVYTVTVSNSVGSVTSSNATLNVNVAPTISTQPASQTVNEGQTVSFGVVASGTAPFTYQWKKNGSNISGATASMYTTPATSSADSGAVYTVTVSNSVGNVTSSNATLTVTVAPSISTQPAAQTVTAGQTATFSVTATGTSPSYQWKKNGSNISGATASTYTTPATSSADNGAVYTVTVSNSAGTVTSNNATLTVNYAPIISIQPASQTVNAGQTVSFGVVASGTATLTYQWKKNGSNISGATASMYTTPATSSADSGAVYTVTVSNAVGSVTSSNATLTVSVVAPSISTQPAAQTITEGQTASFTVAATGTGPFSYQWKKNGSDISGATLSSYTTPAASTADNGAAYSVSVSNSAGIATSGNATLTVNSSSTTRYSLLAKASGGTYDKTECVKDNSTGLLWEGKTASGTRAGGNRYSNYDSTTKAQVWVWTNATDSYFVNPTQEQIDASTNSMSYLQAVNASALCGFTDWRLPTKEELQGIVESTQSPAIDTAWFPNTQTRGYWAASPYVIDSNGAWSVNFNEGSVFSVSRNGDLHVRLVRGTPYSLVAKASGGTYDKTECVKDNITGLVWEGKTASGSRAGVNGYTNFDSTSSAQKWNGITLVNPTQADIDASTNSIGYKNAVNTSALCGFTDWRLPTTDELQGILASSGSPRIDATWFPNTQASYYWSSSPYMGSSNYASVVGFSAGAVYNGNRNYDSRVRLVRGNRYSLVAKASGGTYDKTECVKDNITGLVWEGKTARGSGSRAGVNAYTNLDSTSSAQKWNNGTLLNPTQAEIDASTNSIGYKNAVNTSALCGFTDWRLPTKEELQGILASSGSPRIDATWFPNTQASYYWSSSPYVGVSYNAWVVYFDDGDVGSGNRGYGNGHVRLVR